ncbi:MAG TPA: 1-deoxy-D-xylulose-5-phosphate reductoisomerase [bacterium]|nr:1-deoxy-D-xylulose-5-phosphate reductoisomerase [bacterium]
MGKNVVILGSTGSIGKAALTLFDSVLKDYKVLAISAAENAAELRKQALKYRPKYASIENSGKAGILKGIKGVKILAGSGGNSELAALKEADIVLLGIVGAAGIRPLIAALKAGKTVALANKESLVIAGPIIKAVMKKTGAKIIPVDSEHNAIFQSLMGNRMGEVKRLIVTASGGPFRNTPVKGLKKITSAQALNHPTWKMGKKITIDSATLMNKGLEVIEAHYLFGLPYDKIDVLIHPQSIVHSLVEYIDGSILAQMSNPDMRLPILFALAYPNRRHGMVKPLDLASAGRLDFAEVDFKKFRAFSLALRAGREGGTMPACMNAANEIAVENFLKGRISFDRIPYYIEKAMNNHRNRGNPSIEQVMAADHAARQYVEEMINV